MRWPRGRLLVEGILIAVVIVALAAFDWAFLSAYRATWLGQPLRGLAAWSSGAGNWEIGNAHQTIALQNIPTLGAILSGLWVARRISRGRRGVLVYLGVGLVGLLLLFGSLAGIYMVNVIGGNGPP